jgi:hypothetical protein
VKLAARGSEDVPHADDAAPLRAIREARRRTWGLVGIVLALFALLRFIFGPLPQDQAYHFLADTRALGPIPRAGDVLTNLAILAAGIAGWALWRRVRVAAEERAAYGLLVVGMLATAAGSMWYHWAPGDARLLWDRLPMTLVLAALSALVLADRIHPAFARVAWWPFALLGAASVLWWAWTGRSGADDLMLYLLVRVGGGVLVACLLLLRRGRHTHAGWLVAAIALDVVMTIAERLDYEIFAATRTLISGHSVKHILAGALFGCVLAWLVLRRPIRPVAPGSPSRRPWPWQDRRPPAAHRAPRGSAAFAPAGAGAGRRALRGTASNRSDSADRRDRERA